VGRRLSENLAQPTPGAGSDWRCPLAGLALGAGFDAPLGDGPLGQLALQRRPRDLPISTGTPRLGAPGVRGEGMDIGGPVEAGSHPPSLRDFGHMDGNCVLPAGVARAVSKNDTQ
jgi:hypothetical protein